jgi:hypothetical protein
MASQSIRPFLGLARSARALPLVFAMLAAAPAMANQQAFDNALQSYRTGRVSEAYGRFLALAHKGDPDAAPIVLFMGQYGPMVHGTFWELTDHDALMLRKTAQRPSLRPHPMADPAGYEGAKALPVPLRPETLAGH